LNVISSWSLQVFFEKRQNDYNNSPITKPKQSIFATLYLINDTGGFFIVNDTQCSSNLQKQVIESYFEFIWKVGQKKARFCKIRQDSTQFCMILQIRLSVLFFLRNVTI